MHKIDQEQLPGGYQLYVHNNIFPENSVYFINIHLFTHFYHLLKMKEEDQNHGIHFKLGRK